MTTYRVGDIVVRTEGDFRGVKVGDVNCISEVHGGNICLVGYPGVTFGGDNFKRQEPQVVVGSAPQRFEVGSRVRMIAHSPRYGRGSVNVGDEGVITALKSVGDGFRVSFKPHGPDCWNAGPDDLQLVYVVPTPAISIDEAVKACKTAHSDIADLESKIKELKDSIKGFEQVLSNAGLKFI